MNQSEVANHNAPVFLLWSALSAVYLIWGSTYLAIRFTVETIPPFLSAAARFIVSGFFIYLWRRIAGDPAPGRRDWRNTAVIGILLLVGGNGAVVWAARYIPSSLTALLVTTSPLWMLLLDFIRPGGDKPGTNGLLGILLGFCGAILLIGWSANAEGENSLLGAIVVVAGSALWAAGSIFGKAAQLSSSPLIVTGMEMLVGGSALLLIAFMIGELIQFELTAVSMRSAWAWTYLTAVSPIAFISYAWLLRNAPIPLVATYSYVNPLVAILLGYFLGNELMSLRVLVAAALIIGSVVLISRRR